MNATSVSAQGFEQAKAYRQKENREDIKKDDVRKDDRVKEARKSDDSKGVQKTESIAKTDRKRDQIEEQRELGDRIDRGIADNNAKRGQRLDIVV